MNAVFEKRRSGVLLHPTSLPGPGSTGTLGADAYRFVDFLVEGGFSVWQTLPLGPVDSFGSPYCQRSAYAGDTRLIDTEQLAKSRALPGEMDFDAVKDRPIVAFESFKQHADARQSMAFERFIKIHRRWVFPYGMFELCAARHGGAPWWEWPDEFRGRSWENLVEFVAGNRSEFRSIVFQQYLFDLEWMELKGYANAHGVYMFGDLPFYLDRNSVDVWWSPRLFRLDAAGQPLAVAGVPPDYFNENGQLWGNPLFNWERMREEQFEWWRARIKAQLRLFDLLRIDHFRALESYWEVPADAETARNGEWRQGFGRELLASLRKEFGELPLVAEDLGIITDDVIRLRDEYGLPGMTVLQFAFDGLAHNPHLPQNHLENSISYTGTHDNDTLCGWYASLDEGTRDYVKSIVNLEELPIPERIIEAVYRSRARLAIVPMQDLLGLGSEARMNTPGSAEGNWKWRFRWEDVDESIARRFRSRAENYDRLAA